MPVRNITEFDPTTTFQSGDLIHLGRNSEPDPAKKDKAILGVDLFNAMNQEIGLFGAPASPLSLTADTYASITDYPAEHDPASVADPVAGTITIGKSGAWQITALVMTGTASFDFSIATYIGVTNGASYRVPVSGAAIPNRAGAGDLISMSGATMLSLSAGDVLTLDLISDTSIVLTGYPNASFIVKPIQL